ncbi:MAG TPA: hypothetical protein EYN38_03220 [Flavobacteriales bacterium]|nr:hypothetical protein [Flavobacteriales bacterium]HIO72097.1 hypothetical protein [Flavobacteriales bacterium]
MLKSILSILLLLSILVPIHVSSQPSKSYKKDQKTRDKSRAGSESFANDQEAAAAVLKHYKQELTALDQERLDAEASGDIEKLAKVEQKIRQVKGQMRFTKNKIEEDIVKEYNKIQEKHVRKRMKKNKKKSKRINENKREPFFKRIFKKKRR